MDINALAQDLIRALAPLLPYLTKGTEEIAKEAGKRVAGEAWERSRRIWTKVSAKLPDIPGATQALNELAANPANKPAENALVFHVASLLKSDPELERQLRAEIAEGPLRQIFQTDIENARDVYIGNYGSVATFKLSVRAGAVVVLPWS